MRKYFALWSFTLCLVLTFSVSLAGAEPNPLFDGKTLECWDGNPDWWRVQNGKIIGGSNQKDIPHNMFLMTEESFQNFELVLHVRLYGKGDRPNSGIQVRSARIPDSSEVEGFQVDVGDGYWGKLYDEKRRGWLVGKANNTIKEGKQAANSTSWNKYRIRCEGPTITAWINGKKMFEYTESDKDIPLNGKVGIQVHSGGPSVVEVKKATIKPLPPMENVPTWPEERLHLRRGTFHGFGGRKAATLTDEQMQSAVGLGKQVGIEQEPLSPSEQKDAFILPEGFNIELVAAETDKVGKFINVQWNTAGRLWSMTGLEYPVSTGGSKPGKEVYELFKKGGKDRVVLFDDPYGPGPHKPHTVVDDLVQPLGILPLGSGVYVQDGTHIRFYRDTNGDGKADEARTVLNGFGIHDSHLFPHRFTYSPSGWIYTGQGQFNKSTVRRPGNKPFQDGRKSVTFNNTKLARFRADGSNFEIQSWGPSNIWGFLMSRQGEQFMQDANDRGIPVTPFEPGTIYAGKRGKSKPYAPQQPTSFDSNKMGGTGLSGLALSDDRGVDGWPLPWGQSDKQNKRFLIANPLNSRVQRVVARWNEDKNHYEYEKKSPLLMSKDPWFRPVATHFGPDGALYIVDWYNKIISHNEIPIDHKARDTRRGRIWRITHEDQRRNGVPNLRKLNKKQLLNHLGNNNTRLSNLAWQEIHRRNAESLAPDLIEIIRSNQTRIGRTFAALWALEGITDPPEQLLLDLLDAENGNLRREAVRIIDEHRLLTDQLTAKLQERTSDPYHRVRAAIGNLLRRRTNNMTPELIRMATRLGGSASTSGNEWQSYYGKFERYLARWALEGNHDHVRNLLTSNPNPPLSASAKAYAGFLLDSKQGAKMLARAASGLDRQLTNEEVSLLARHFQEPNIRDAVLSLLEHPKQRDRVLGILSDLNQDEITPELRTAVWQQINNMLSSKPNRQEMSQLLKLVGTFRLKKLAPNIRKWVRSSDLDTEDRVAGIRTLRKITPGAVDLFSTLAQSNSASVCRAALLALTASDASEALDHALNRIKGISLSLRRIVLQRLASSSTHAPGLVQAALNNRVSGLNGEMLDRLESVLGTEHDGLDRLRERIKQKTEPVLHVGKDGDGYAKVDLTLDRAFTVEAWVRLIPPITNRHHLVGATDGASDFNFHASQFRVHNGDRDVVIANSKIQPRSWTHVAVTRDKNGHFRIYMNGELDGKGQGENDRAFRNLQVGTGRVDGASAYYTEFRVWSEQRSGEEIRTNLLKTFRNKSNRPSNLKHYYYGENWPPRKGNAEIVRLRDLPEIRIDSEQSEKFESYLSVIEKAGNADHGQKIFQNRCSTCHTTGGEDREVGPSLKGIAHSGNAAMLSSVLNPDAAIQSGYHAFRVKTTDGNLFTGVKQEENPNAIVLQLVSGSTKRIPRDQIASTKQLDSSIMPKGLLNGLSDKQVRDLFSYLNTLK